MMPFLFALAVLAGCPFGDCSNGDDGFVVVVEGLPEPESALITIGGVEHEMNCYYVESWDETHCDYPLESIDEVTAAAIVVDGTRIELDPETATYEDGGECGRGGHYFLNYAHPYTGCIDAYDVPFCEDDTLPIAGGGCFEPCEHDGAYCEIGSCTEAWIGCAPDADCDVCGVSDWICL
jgi:hypothetical protein